MIFSKILLKSGNKDISLSVAIRIIFFATVELIGVVLDNFSFEEYFPNVTEKFNISDRIGAMILLAHFINFMGDEYRPQNLLFGMESI